LWPFRRDPPTGTRGEKLAVRYLRRAGCSILARNYRCPVGEADVIVLDKSTRSQWGAESIAFVEVKTRSSDDSVAPESAVDRRKRRQLVRVARYYLAHHETGERRVRFDVVSVVLPPGGKPQVRHISDAFEP
jgi:putative endonuclease